MPDKFDPLSIFTPAVQDEIQSIPGFADLLRDQWLDSHSPEPGESLELRNFGPGELDERGIEWLVENTPDDAPAAEDHAPHWRSSEAVVRVATSPAAAHARSLVVEICNELEARGDASEHDIGAFREYVESIQRLLDERKDQPETIVTGFAHAR